MIHNIMYLVDAGGCTARSVNLTSLNVTTVAGSDTVCSAVVVGTYPKSRLSNGVDSVAYDPVAGLLYASDHSNDVILSINVSSSNYNMSILAGTYGSAGYVNGFGTNGVKFNHPSGMALNPTTRMLYINDKSTSVIRQLNLATMEVELLAGIPNNGGYIDGAGSVANFGTLNGLAIGFNATGTQLYVTDNCYMRVVVLS